MRFRLNLVDISNVTFAVTVYVLAYLLSLFMCSITSTYALHLTLDDFHRRLLQQCESLCCTFSVQNSDTCCIIQV